MIRPQFVELWLCSMPLHGSVDKRKHPPNSGTTVLTKIDKIVILETVLDRPEMFLCELQQTLILETGTCVDVSTIWRFL